MCLDYKINMSDKFDRPEEKIKHMIEDNQFFDWKT